MNLSQQVIMGAGLVITTLYVCDVCISHWSRKLKEREQAMREAIAEMQLSSDKLIFLTKTARDMRNELHEARVKALFESGLFKHTFSVDLEQTHAAEPEPSVVPNNHF